MNQAKVEEEEEEEEERDWPKLRRHIKGEGTSATGYEQATDEPHQPTVGLLDKPNEQSSSTTNNCADADLDVGTHIYHENCNGGELSAVLQWSRG
ncbi:unnamed protein product [Ceratitis capitata]|uniref:(Mediterranean fruit fly) hypothetical protein n=1 Tax=Ceratitis capitata TaxID=7213 RepID=A0A811V5Y2_CERCA|nr:unnamed protein product [Ceratitis capitata]